ncbi:LOW QUALITY PROTEIN: malonyl-coenzyme:anthocyanin 5-O-glucoside-6'''-O-malonyltransferase-like [Daucus carota subsp. sativus]|uniref:LOW QUALITY PROTEIN: malonyl-coenzyme:anthocyanin 5-O-glucoside-6'''-O-malonyltransferase-like n=1 Tax=Daucus carota subsp. sativus TaxID=79200 RepID=UPI00308367BA
MANAAGINMVSVLEHHRVSPPLDPSVTVKLLPLTFFDMMWLTLPPLSRVYFYDFPRSTSQFIETVVPPLKKSLALALKYYFPLCGNLIIPTNLTSNTTPAIRYSNDDSVSLTIAEFSGATSKGFEHLSGNHPRDVDELFALVPQLPRGDTEKVGEDGFCKAVEEINKVLDEKINNNEGVLKGLETYFDDIKAAKGPALGVAGSPKFDYYTTDFGWGKPKKYEHVTGICVTRDLKGDLGIGICLSKNEMDLFTTSFIQGLTN